ncbi:response regulator transcription factor [Flaviflexus huanghaiensis]|uniref:response regulator transcription factor n=1 Tax=Flaviflexus huanghaiensis TaxID=1111473 RepID=UPI0015FD94C5|nr:response regulator transcription factor [Flaviflexus huanghaiensis]
MSNLVALIVDDERQMLSIVGFALEVQGFDFVEASGVTEAWRILSSRHIDIVVLDVMMPSGSGIDLVTRIRASSNNVPIILLTALGGERDRIKGLEAGADDYVTKPFSPRELALRAQAIVRRSQPVEGRDRLEHGPLSVDLQAMVAYWQKSRIDLSATETRVLLALARRIGDIVSHRELLNEAWATTESAGGREMVKTTIYRLRRNLASSGAVGAHIEAHRGLGYSLTIGPSGDA